MRYGTKTASGSYLQSHIDPELKREMLQEVVRRGMNGYKDLLAEMWNCYVEKITAEQTDEGVA